MTRRMMMLAALAVTATLASPLAAQDAGKMMADVRSKAAGAMAMLSMEYEGELETREITGPAVCIEKSGILMTTALDARLQIDKVKSLSVVIPGSSGETLPAELMGIDPRTSLGFVKVTEPHDWQVVQFTSRSDLNVGDVVGSVGMMGPDSGYALYVSAAYVSGKLRVPGELIHVASGKLTGVGSPVFAANGMAIGIVGRQLYLNYQTVSQRGQTVPLPLQGQHETAFFTPVEEFADVLSNIPSGGKIRRLAWLGALDVNPVGDELAALWDVEDVPAVQLDRIVPGSPAAEAGLTDRSVVTKLDGEALEGFPTPELIAQSFTTEIVKHRPGEKVTLTVKTSGGQTRDVTVTLGEMPVRPDEAPRYISRRLGFGVREKIALDEYLLQGPEAGQDGVLVILVAKNSPAARAGLRADDLIARVNDQPVDSVALFERVLSAAVAEGGVVNITAMRNGRTKPVSIPVPAARGR